MEYRECHLPRRRPTCIVILLIAGLLAASCSSTASFLTKGEDLLQKRKFHDALMQFKSAAETNDSSAPAHWGMARAYENLGQFNETVEELRKTVDLDKNNLEARAKLGNYFLLVQPPMIVEAEAMRDEILQADGSFIEGHLLTASILAAQGRPDTDIVNVVSKAISLDPKRIESYISLQRFYMTREKADEAEKAIKSGLAESPDSVKGHVEYGRFLMYSNRDTEAEKEFDAAVDLRPNDIEAREAVAEFYMTSGQLEKAEKAYLQLAEVQENSPESRLELASFYERTGRSQDAVATLKEILAATPEYARARYQLIKIYTDGRDHAAAEEHLAALFKVNDHDFEALMARARLRLQQERAQDAIADLEEVLKKQPSGRDALFSMAQAKLAAGKPDQANAFLSDLERYHPTYVKAGLIRIQAAFNAGDPAGAMKSANELIEKAGKAQTSADLTPEMLQDVRLRAVSSRGLAQLELGKFAEAKIDLEEVAKASPRSAGARVNIARVNVAEKNFSAAAAQFQKALDLDPRSFDALSGLVTASVRAGELGPAHKRLDEAISSNAGKGEVLAAVHYLKASAYVAEKNSAGAEQHFQASFEHDPDYLPAYTAYAGFLVSTNRGDEALAQYRKLAEKRPASPAFTMVGILEDSRGNSGEAEKAYRKALELNPNSPIAANNLAWLITERQGNLDEALQLATAAVNKSQGTAGFYDTLGWIYLKKGLYSPAVEQLKKAVSLEEANAQRNGVPADSGYRTRLGMALAKASDKAAV